MSHHRHRPNVGRRTARSGLSLALVVAVSGLAGIMGTMGCRTGATTGATVTPVGGGDGPNVGPDPEGRQESDNIGDLKARLDRLSQQRRKVSAGGETGFTVCEDLCDLASNICIVKDKLCGLADDHPSDDSYQNLCREARNECREANESCIACAEGSGNQSEPEPPNASLPE